MWVCVHICQQCTLMDCTSHLTYIIIIVDICHCNLIKISWFFVFALLCFVCFWFVCLFVVLALYHHLTTFRTGFITADLSFMVDRPFVSVLLFRRVEYPGRVRFRVRVRVRVSVRIRFRFRVRLRLRVRVSLKKITQCNNSSGNYTLV